VNYRCRNAAARSIPTFGQLHPVHLSPRGSPLPANKVLGGIDRTDDAIRQISSQFVRMIAEMWNCGRRLMSQQMLIEKNVITAAELHQRLTGEKFFDIGSTAPTMRC